MKETRALRLMQEVGVVRHGHFVYTSGTHGGAYVNKDAVYQYPDICAELCFGIAKAFMHDGIEAVIGPEKGGIILAQWTAYHLSKLHGRSVLAGFAEKDDSQLVLRRGYDKMALDKRVLIVEDILNTGGSAKGAVDAVRRCAGRVTGVGALWNRGGVTTNTLCTEKLVALVNKRFPAYDARTCPLCKDGTPIDTDVGKGSDFLARRPAS